MKAYMKNRENIKHALMEKFGQSTNDDKSIILNMKLDNVSLIVIPHWCSNKEDKNVEKADAFTVYAEKEDEKITIPCLSALSFDELVCNIEGYSGINFDYLEEHNRAIS